MLSRQSGRRLGVVVSLPPRSWVGESGVPGRQSEAAVKTAGWYAVAGGPSGLRCWLNKLNNVNSILGTHIKKPDAYMCNPSTPLVRWKVETE